MKGIEPSSSAWKAVALPLSYTRVEAMNYHAMGRPASEVKERYNEVWDALLDSRSRAVGELF